MKNFALLSILFSFSFQTYSQNGIPFLTNQDNFCISTGNFQGNWQLIGPKSYAAQNMGRIDPVWVDPDDSSHLLAASLSGGLFEKQSGTMTWIPLTNKLPGIGVHDIAVHKNVNLPSTIVISTGTGINDPQRSYGWGLYYSTNGGVDWIFDQDFYDLVNEASPKVSKAKFIYGSDGMVAITGNKILKKSSFNNAWQLLTLPASHDDIDLTELEMAPTNSNFFWIAGGGAESGVLYTVDGGNSFHDVTSDLAGLTGYNLSMTASADAYVYYFVNPGGGKINHYVYNSDTEIFGLESTQNPGFVGINFVVSSTNQNAMYTGTIPIFKSTDFGATWNYPNGINTGHDDVRTISLYPVSGAADAVFVGNDGGVSKSIDGGALWKNLNGTGLAVSQFYGLSGIEEQPNLLFGGAQDNHTWRIENEVPSFSYQYNDGYGTESYRKNTGEIILFLQKGPGNSSHNANLYRKIDGTSPTLPGIDITPNNTTDPEKFSKPLYKSTITGRFYVGQNDLYWSDDDGDSYFPEGLSDPDHNKNYNAVSAFDVSPLNQDRIYVAYDASGDYIPPGSTEGNKQYNKQFFYKDPQFGWQNRTPSYNANPDKNNCGDYLTCYQQITGVVSDPKDYNRVWITLSDRWNNFEKNADGTLKKYKDGGVYFSKDAGLTWTAMTTDLPNFYINCIVYENGT
ncbi:MAG: hypothetical protein LH473_12950, partial [Chitinophagales bacterium]|nr:hypothetical protein [Chitinophagales bacterium]